MHDLIFLASIAAVVASAFYLALVKVKKNKQRPKK
jgi:hypothetical protein